MQADLAAGAAFEAGERAWPGVDVAYEIFAAWAVGAGVETEDLRLRGADLFLACGCASGDRRAIAYFESELLSRVRSYVGRLGLTDLAIDEIRQNLRVKLLMGVPPGITGYRGRGPLGAWVRVTALRLGLRHLGAEKAAPRSAELELLDFGVGLDDDPERATAKNLYRDRLRAALEESLRSLDARDRTLLRFYVVDGLSIDDMSAIYRVHRATVARWLVAIRARVLQGSRGRLGLGKDASPSELRSLITLLRDEIHISARRVLASGPG